eukprot:jgi/Mesvir1/15272/Mv06490-RA.1
MAAAFDGGVILGADSRVSTGAYISNRASDKLSAIADNVFVCRSGSAADTQAVSDYVRHFLHQHSIEQGENPTVKVAANLTMQLAYSNKRMLMAGMIVAGWDKHAGGSVYALPIGGTLLHVPFATGGSGSTYMCSYCDHQYREGMTAEETEAFVVKGIALAMARDSGSGGMIRIVKITKSGVERRIIRGKDVPIWHEEMAPAAGM